MNKYPVIQNKLSVNFINLLRKFQCFDGDIDYFSKVKMPERSEEVESASETDACRPPQCVLKDTHSDSQGLRLRLSRSGKMTFVVHGRIAKAGSSAQYFTIGNAREMYLHSARKMAGAFRTFMSEGKDPVSEHRKQKAIFTLEQFHREYLEAKGVKSVERLSGLKPETILEYKKNFNRLSSKFISRDALRISRDDVKNEHLRISKTSSPFMADKTMHYVAAIFRRARKRHIDESENVEIIRHNPVDILTLDRSWFVNNGQSRRIRACIDSDDVGKVLDGIDKLESYCDGIKHKRTISQRAIVASHYFKFLMFTGWRPEEVCAIEWDQVSEDFKDVTWNDEQAAKKLKGAESQYRAPLNSVASDILRSIKNKVDSSKWVFPANNMTSAISQNPTDYIDALEKIIGNGTRYTCGIYRKTFQTYAEVLSINPSTIKRLVFHTQAHYDVQSGYIALNRENLRRKSEKIADYILKLAGRKSDAQAEDISINGDIMQKAYERALLTDTSIEEVINEWISIGLKFQLMKF